MRQTSGNDFFVYLPGVVLTAQALLGLAFLFSCIWEREKRAAFFGGLQFIGMAGFVAIVFLLKANGFYETAIGKGFLITGYDIGILATIDSPYDGPNLAAVHAPRALSEHTLKIWMPSNPALP